MRSKVTILGHPIHPMLTSFPVALYTASLVSYIVFAYGGSVFWFQAGYASGIAGVVMAAVAAIPGLIDWALAVPSRHPAKKTGLIHLSFNVLALVIFAFNTWLQSGQWNDLFPLARGAVFFSALGVISTILAGFFGWKMVQTHHVGVELSSEQEKLELAPPHELFPEEKRKIG